VHGRDPGAGGVRFAGYGAGAGGLRGLRCYRGGGGEVVRVVAGDGDEACVVEFDGAGGVCFF
jgi:hypothetical protein